MSKSRFPEPPSEQAENSPARFSVVKGGVPLTADEPETDAEREWADPNWTVFDGVASDVERHIQRCLTLAQNTGLPPTIDSLRLIHDMSVEFWHMSGLYPIDGPDDEDFLP